jgi:NAD(P)-dependent dehydrogenase (short-subunit alcohol dehydrogenase family)
MTDETIFLPGRTAVITGAADGIGLAAARRCAAAGMNVMMADLRAEVLEASAEAVRADAAGKVTSQALDVGDFAAVTAMKERAFAELGDIALLMNNAGAGFGSPAFGDLEGWRRTFDVNLWGVVHGVQAFTSAMIDQGAPARIVNTGSKQGITNPPGNPAYNATKAAVKSVTESLQHSLRNIEGCQVTTHLLIPGFTFTGLTRRRLADRPPAAWSAEQVVDEMVRVLGDGGFYILCPDNETTPEMDSKRILWGAQDLAVGRSALSRWDPRYEAEFAAYMAGPGLK